MEVFSCWTVYGAMLILAILSAVVDSEAFCPLPTLGETLYVRCSFKQQNVPCGKMANIGTEIQFQCAQFYKLENKNDTSAKCLSSGQWSLTPPRCIPDCGKLPSAVPLIVRGQVIPAGSIPWHAALYEETLEGWEYLCGASLVSERMVLTAAHCAWQQTPNKLKVVLGKFYRNYTALDENPQFMEVSGINMLDSYQDIGGNYNGDVALLILKEDVKFSDSVLPVCIDWNQQFTENQLRQKNSGIVTGWGLTENDTFSEELRAIRLPVMADENCIKEQQRDFKKFVTYTTFCAGYTNGSGVCNGDSGGGLSFLDPETDTWYLQGVVSVSPRRRGTPFCDPTHYTVFTKVSAFTSWLQKIEGKKPQIKSKTQNVTENVAMSEGTTLSNRGMSKTGKQTNLINFKY